MSRVWTEEQKEAARKAWADKKAEATGEEANLYTGDVLEVEDNPAPAKIDKLVHEALISGTFDPLAFSDEEMVELKADAARQAREEFRAIEKKRILAKLIAEEREKISPSPEEEPEQDVALTIDVPACCIINKSNDTGVVINGREFLYGRTYTNKVPKDDPTYISGNLAADIRYIMARANANEKALGYPNRDANQRRVIDARLGQVIPMPAVSGP